MAKKQTFADKATKGQRRSKLICPKCETEYSFFLHVAAEKSGKTGAYKFGERHIRVCKCNEKQIYN